MRPKLTVKRFVPPIAQVDGLSVSEIQLVGAFLGRVHKLLVECPEPFWTYEEQFTVFVVRGLMRHANVGKVLALLEDYLDTC